MGRYLIQCSSKVRLTREEREWEKGHRERARHIEILDGLDWALRQRDLRQCSLGVFIVYSWTERLGSELQIRKEAGFVAYSWIKKTGLPQMRVGLAPRACVHKGTGAIMLKVSWDQTREIGLQGLNSVGEVSVGGAVLSRKYPWRESYEGHFLYTLSIHTWTKGRFSHPSKPRLGLLGEGLAIFPCSLTGPRECQQHTFTQGFIHARLPLFPIHRDRVRHNAKAEN